MTDPRTTSEIDWFEVSMNSIRRREYQKGHKDGAQAERERIISVLIGKVQCPDWPCPEDMNLCTRCWAKYLDAKEAE